MKVFHNNVRGNEPSHSLILRPTQASWQGVWGKIITMDLLENFDIDLTVNEILRGEGADPEIVRANKPAMLNAATSALLEGIPMLHPVALTHSANVIEHLHEAILLEGGLRLTGGLISRHLSGAMQIAAVICTIGGELETKIKKIFSIDAALALAFDGLGNAAVEKIAQQVCGRIEEQAQGRGLSASSPLSPGETEWPVEVGQQQIFNLLGASQSRITLTSGGMMVPKKSISFVVGIGPEMSQTDPCQLCNLRERCQYRHA